MYADRNSRWRAIFSAFLLTIGILSPVSGDRIRLTPLSAYTDYGWRDTELPVFRKPDLLPSESFEEKDGFLIARDQAFTVVYTGSGRARKSLLLVYNIKTLETRRLPAFETGIFGLAYDENKHEILVRLERSIAFLDEGSLQENRLAVFSPARGWQDIAVRNDELLEINRERTGINIFSLPALKLTTTLMVADGKLQRIFPLSGGEILVWSSYWTPPRPIFLDRRSGLTSQKANIDLPHRALFKSSPMSGNRLGVLSSQPGDNPLVLLPCGTNWIPAGPGMQTDGSGNAHRFAPFQQRIKAVFSIRATEDIPEGSFLFLLPQKSTYAQEITDELPTGSIVIDVFGNRFLSVPTDRIRAGEQKTIELYSASITRYHACFDFMSARDPLTIPAGFDRYLGNNELLMLQDDLVRNTHNRLFSSLQPYNAVVKAVHAFSYTIDPLWDGLADPVPLVLKHMHGGCNEHTRVIVAMLRLSGIPARFAWNYRTIQYEEKNFAADHFIAEAWVSGLGWIPLEGLAPSEGFLRPYIMFEVGVPENRNHRPETTGRANPWKERGGSITWILSPAPAH